MTASYSQVALLAGKPGASRAVVRALDSKMPWWRVVKSDGTVAAAMLSEQAPKLAREGVKLTGRRVPQDRRWNLRQATVSSRAGAPPKKRATSSHSES